MSVHDNREGPARITRYVLQFCIAFLSLDILTVGITSALNVSAPQVTLVIILIGALLFPIRAFVRERRRPFRAGERFRFTTAVAAASLGLGATIMAIYLKLFELLGARSPMLDTIDEAIRQGFSPAGILTLTAVLWLVVSWIVAYVSTWLISKIWHNALSTATTP